MATAKHTFTSAAYQTHMRLPLHMGIENQTVVCCKICNPGNYQDCDGVGTRQQLQIETEWSQQHWIIYTHVTSMYQHVRVIIQENTIKYKILYTPIEI